MQTITLYRRDFKPWADGYDFIGQSHFDAIVQDLRPDLSSDDVYEIDEIEIVIDSFKLDIPVI